GGACRCRHRTDSGAWADGDTFVRRATGSVWSCRCAKRASVTHMTRTTSIRTDHPGYDEPLITKKEVECEGWLENAPDSETWWETTQKGWDPHQCPSGGPPPGTVWVPLRNRARQREFHTCDVMPAPCRQGRPGYPQGQFAGRSTGRGKATKG